VENPALLTDFYELTMAAALVAEGRSEIAATFSLFIRSLPPERGFLVAAGLDDVVSFLDDFSFSGDDVEAIAGLGRFDPAFLDWLRQVRFEGSLRAIPEGRVAFETEPLLEVTAPFGVAQLLETYLLNQITVSTTLATKAARCRHAAAGRRVVDFALRRAQGTDAGMKVARCAAIAGFDATSNVAAAIRYGLTASGTMAHSFITAHPDELEAFRSFARTAPTDPVLLVDTYDTETGVEKAVIVGQELKRIGRRLAGIRLDSGDVAALARRARSRLDAAGLTDTAILASGGIDEYEIARLVALGAPIDGFGIGTRFGVSEDVPVLESVYKLVEIEGRPVAKRSPGKATLPGAKQAWRRPGFSGDLVALAREPEPVSGAEPLLGPVGLGAPRSPAAAIVAAARERFEADWCALPVEHKDLINHIPYRVDVSTALRRLADLSNSA
jgi:nicotinate phosphoribosyltransferase